MARDEVNLDELSLEKRELSSLNPETLLAILDNVYKGVIVVNREGRIVFLSRSNEKFYGLRPGEALGKHVTEVIKNSRLHIVAKTGKAEIGHIIEVKEGEYRVAESIPIKKDGKAIGAIGKIMFSDIEKAKSLASRIHSLEVEVSNFRKQFKDLFRARYNFENILGESRVLRKAKETALKSAQASSTVLILGESGTGKELFAHSIHNSSPRREHPFVRVNCASIPPELFEAEFFGYDQGAFTGAHPRGRKGLFQLAHLGTIFLDEISELPFSMQSKLLRVLQEKEVRKIGSDKVLKLDFRLIASSNRDLDQMVASGRFRDDLFYRLNVITLNLPPLRDHLEDLQLLTLRFIQELNADLGTNVSGLSDEAWQVLRSHAWKGNVRELRNALERAMTVCQGKVLEAQHLQSHLVSGGAKARVPASPSLLLNKTREAAERETIRAALVQAKGNKRQACRILGISRSGLYQKLSLYGLSADSSTRTPRKKDGADNLEGESTESAAQNSPE